MISLIESVYSGQSLAGSGIPLVFLQTKSKEVIIDLCFFVFNLLSKSFAKSPSFSKLRSFFFARIQDLLYLPSIQHISNPLYETCKSIIVIDKITFFLGLYIESLLLDFKLANSTPIIFLRDGVENYMEIIIYYLFQSLLNFQNSQGTSHIASFSISNLLSIKYVIPYYKTFMRGFFEKLVSAITEIEVNPYFELIKNLIKTEDILDSNAIQLVVKKSVERILKEIKSYKPSEEDESDQMSVPMNHCLNILIEISEKNIISNEEAAILQNSGENKSIISKISAQAFENLVMDLFNYAKKPTKIPCASEIIQLVTNILKKSSTVPESSILLYGSFNLLLTEVNMNKKIFEFIYELINKSEVNFQNPQNSHTLVMSLIDSTNDDEEDIDFIYLCLSIQHLILVSSKDL